MNNVLLGTKISKSNINVETMLMRSDMKYVLKTKTTSSAKFLLAAQTKKGTACKLMKLHAILLNFM